MPEPELTQESDLPEHPLESMGRAKLTQSQGMPEDAITEEEAIDLVRDLTWRPQRDFYEKSHPASAIPATYDAEENTMGPAADNLPVWVVVLDGWGRSVSNCGRGIGPQGDPEASGKSSGEEGSGSGDDCLTVETSSPPALK